LFQKLCAALEVPEIAADPRFATNGKRNQHVELLGELLERRLKGATTQEWLAKLEPAGIPCGPINTVADALAEPQVAARNMIVETRDPVAGPVHMAGNPIKLSSYADPTERAPAPELDADRAAILRELGL